MTTHRQISAALSDDAAGHIVDALRAQAKGRAPRVGPRSVNAGQQPLDL